MSYIVYFQTSDKKLHSVKFSKEVQAIRAVESLKKVYPNTNTFFVKKLNLVRRAQK